MNITAQEITTQLEELRSFDSRYTIFPIIVGNDVERFECRFQIRLPEDFRWFITHVCNGGIGPGMGVGVYPLQEIQRVLEVHAEIEHLAAEQVVCTHFSCPSTVEESEQLPMLCTPGMLPVAHAGCGREYYLCVSGIERGHIWFWGQLWYPFTALNNHPIYQPYHPRDTDAYDDIDEEIVNENDRIFKRWVMQLLSPQNTYRVTFLEWYRLWLAESLQRWRRGVNPKSTWEDWFMPVEQ